MQYKSTTFIQPLEEILTNTGAKNSKINTAICSKLILQVPNTVFEKTQTLAK